MMKKEICSINDNHIVKVLEKKYGLTSNFPKTDENDDENVQNMIERKT